MKHWDNNDPLTYGSPEYEQRAKIWQQKERSRFDPVDWFIWLTFLLMMINCKFWLVVGVMLFISLIIMRKSNKW